jgi:catechol 2,3-dioxygenase-like lactoylglutathione lyase family enzyme
MFEVGEEVYTVRPAAVPRAQRNLPGAKQRSLEMLGNNEVSATVAVKNLKAARKFYEGALGLKPVHTEGEEAVSYKTGNSQLLVYHSQYAGSNKATGATWIVADLEKLVKDLKSKGITFEHYDMPGVTRKGDVHIAGKIRNAWFKDPDGNILALVSE